MVQTFVVELEWANNIPGVSGVEDAEIEVPEPSDLEDIIIRLVPDIGDIEEAVADQVPQLFEIVSELERVRDEIIEAVDDVTVDLGDVSQDIRDEVDDALQDLTLDPEEIADDVADEISDALPAQVLNTDEVATAVADRLGEELTGGTVDVEALAEDVASQLDTEGATAPQVNVSGVFGPLTNDVVQAFNRILDERVQAPDVDIPSVEDVRTAVGEEVEGILRDLPIAPLLFNPRQAVLDEADDLLRDALSEETKEELLERRGGQP